MPVVCGTSKAWILSGKVFCHIKCQSLIILCNGGPFFEGLDVGDQAWVCPMGAARDASSQSSSRTPSMISRFCASLMPAE